MKKRVIIALFMAVVAACSEPRTIPRDDLKEIFKEAFLVNAYYDSHSYDYDTPDSIDIYRPILARRGYDIADLEYTMVNFSRKKSAKLTDVVEQAIAELTSESQYYNSRVALADTLNAIARRTYRRKVLWRDSIEANSIKDTALLRVAIPVEEGEYEVSYSYIIDTLDKNSVLHTSVNLLDSMGRRRGGGRAEYMSNRGTRQRPNVNRAVADSLARELEIEFANYPARDLKTPHIRIDSLLVNYYLPPEKALDSMNAWWSKIGTYGAATHSGPLRPRAPWIDTLATPDAR